jgi:hypothetical protein
MRQLLAGISNCLVAVTVMRSDPLRRLRHRRWRVPSHQRQGLQRDAILIRRVAEARILERKILTRRNRKCFAEAIVRQLSRFPAS